MGKCFVPMVAIESCDMNPKIDGALLPGYEDANSLARVFRGWEGIPPKHWRENHRATVVQ